MAKIKTRDQINNNQKKVILLKSSGEREHSGMEKSVFFGVQYIVVSRDLGAPMADLCRFVIVSRKEEGGGIVGSLEPHQKQKHTKKQNKRHSKYALQLY